MANYDPVPFPKKMKNKGGRPFGAKNVKTQILKDALLIAAAELGEIKRVQVLNDDGQPTGECEYTYDGLDGLVGYLRWAGIHRPASFLSLLGRVLPTQLNIKTASTLKVTYKTEAEARKALNERGINDLMVACLELDHEGNCVGEGDAKS